MVRVGHRIHHWKRVRPRHALQDRDRGMTHDREVGPLGEVPDDIGEVLLLVQCLGREEDRLEPHPGGVPLEGQPGPQAGCGEEQGHGAVESFSASGLVALREPEQLGEVLPRSVPQGLQVTHGRLRHLPPSMLACSSGSLKRSLAITGAGPWSSGTACGT